MTKLSSKSGFTIVELLIVIIVIGILATIITLSYLGVTKNARSSQASTNAAVVQKKIEAYASATGAYPSATSYTAYLTNLNSLSDSTLNGTNIILGAVTTTNPSYIQISQCTLPASYANGMAYRIQYWNYNSGATSTTVLTNTLSSTACTGWTPLT